MCLEGQAHGVEAPTKAARMIMTFLLIPWKAQQLHVWSSRLAK